MQNYSENARLLKALGDRSRLEIVDMLSGGELCACKILEKFNITQPTLSHHMKTLCECGLVTGRKAGKWIYYSLNGAKLGELQELFATLATGAERHTSSDRSASCEKTCCEEVCA